MHIIPIIFPFHIWEVIWTTYRYYLPPEAEGLSQQDHQTVTIRSQRNRIQHNNCRSLSVWKRQRFSGNIPLTVHKNPLTLHSFQGDPFKPSNLGCNLGRNQTFVRRFLSFLSILAYLIHEQTHAHATRTDEGRSDAPSTGSARLVRATLLLVMP